MMKMVGRILAGSAVLALSAGAAAAQSIKDYPEVADTSFVQANGHKVLRIALDVPAPRKAVWERFTTTEGYRAWAVPVALVDGRLGGMIEGSYDFTAKVGDPDNIRNQIVVFQPEQTLAIRNVNAPKALPGREQFGEIVTVMEFADAGRLQAGRALRHALQALRLGQRLLADEAQGELHQRAHRLEAGPGPAGSPSRRQEGGARRREGSELR